MMKDVVLVEERTVTLSAVGETVTWSPAGTKRHCEVIPVSASAKLAYQQMNSVVTHRVVFNGKVTVRLGDHRFVWGAKTLIPSQPAEISGGKTVVMVRE
jgi:hypothetical protein